MDKKDIFEVAEKNNGYVCAKQIKEQGIPSSYLSRLVKENKLERVYKGVYITPETFEDPEYIYSLRYPNIIYSGESAMFLNLLSCKQYVNMVEVTVPYGTTVPKIEGAKVIVSRKKNIDLGVTIVNTCFGNPVKCYDKERTICDLFMRPDNFDSEDRVYAIKKYNQYYLNRAKLYEYAKQLGVYSEVKNVYEVLVWN